MLVPTRRSYGYAKCILPKIFPKGLSRNETRKTTPLNLFEGVAVEAALALQQRGKLATKDVSKWVSSRKLRSYTTGATNSLPTVIGRIEFCRGRFLGKPYVDFSTF